MEIFFEWVSNNPIATNVIITAFGLIITSTTILYIAAFFQGRSVSFWPPKIGSKPIPIIEKTGKKIVDDLDTPPHTDKTIAPHSLGDMDVLGKTGIVKVFANLNECKDDMIADFVSSKEIRLLLQIGRRELGDGISSMFYNYTKHKNHPGMHLRVLRAGKSSPFLSHKRLERRGRTNYEELYDQLNRLHDIIFRLKNSYHVNIDEREHREPFLWRIFMFDDIAYVSGYLYKSGNDNTATVYKITKGKNSIYAIFDKYFEYLWKKYEPDSKPETDEHWIDWE